MAVVIFINLGYAHEQFPAFLKACDDVRAGVDSAEARMFVWSDSGADAMDKPLAPHFLQDSHGNWRWSERAGKYFWVKWEGERGGYHLPQFNFGDPGWQAEVRRILEFWLAMGIDGVVIDAVNWYIDCNWGIARSSMTDAINAYDNQFSQPEGAGGFGDDPVPWIEQGRFNCVMDYAIKLWWEDVDVIRDAIRGGDPRPIEAALRGYRDRIVAAGGVCYIDTPHLPDAPPAARLLGIATVATIGELFLTIGDDDATWPEAERRAVTALLEARRRYPALCAGGARIQLPTSDDSRFYAFLRVPRGEGARVLVALNFQPDARRLSIDLRGHTTGPLVDIWSHQAHPAGDVLNLTLPGYGYALYALPDVPPGNPAVHREEDR
jgi:glycosidase